MPKSSLPQLGASSSHSGHLSQQKKGILSTLQQSLKAKTVDAPHTSSPSSRRYYSKLTNKVEASCMPSPSRKDEILHVPSSRMEHDLSRPFLAKPRGWDMPCTFSKDRKPLSHQAARMKCITRLLAKDGIAQAFCQAAKRRCVMYFLVKPQGGWAHQLFEVGCKLPKEKERKKDTAPTVPLARCFNSAWWNCVIRFNSSWWTLVPMAQLLDVAYTSCISSSTIVLVLTCEILVLTARSLLVLYTDWSQSASSTCFFLGW